MAKLWKQRAKKPEKTYLLNGEQVTADVYADLIEGLLPRILISVAVSTLREAAKAWGDPSPENVQRLRDLAEKHYHVGGPSMPEIFLNLRADELDRGEQPFIGVPKKDG